MNEHVKIVFQSLFVGLLAGGLFAGGALFERWDGNIDLSSKTDTSSNYSLEEYSLVALDELKTFYKYNSSNVGEDLTDEQLKTEGGVCDHYATWYVNKFKENGFEGKEIDLYGDTRGHAIALVWDNNLTEYCLLDQLERSCIRLG